MSHGTVTQTFGDGTYSFRLAIGQWLELQDKCNSGPAELYERLLRQRWRVQDLRETIRLGLIGGGMQPVDALKLVQRYVDDRPLLENVGLAANIIGASLIAPEVDDQPGEAEVAKEPDKGKSPSPRSMETVQ